MIYVFISKSDVPSEDDDPLEANAHYGSSGSIIEELKKRLPHSGPIFQDDNKTVYMMVSKAVLGTSVESTIKSYARTKNGREAYLALLTNHAGDTKYRAIVKSKTNFLTNIKWNGRSFPLENHVSRHRNAVDKLIECAEHIGNPVPDPTQRVEYLLDSITSQDSSLQAAIGNIRADSAGLRKDFEKASSHMLEVDPYKKTTRINRVNVATISAVSFSG